MQFYLSILYAVVSFQGEADKKLVISLMLAEAFQNILSFYKFKGENIYIRVLLNLVICNGFGSEVGYGSAKHGDIRVMECRSSGVEHFLCRSDGYDINIIPFWSDRGRAEHECHVCALVGEGACYFHTHQSGAMVPDEAYGVDSLVCRAGGNQYFLPCETMF